MADVTYYYTDVPEPGQWNDWNSMVDGILETYAYTTQKGLEETVRQSTCPGDDLGIITKVELRAYGYGDGNDKVSLGRFGFEHLVTMPSSPDWSSYVNVTGDEAWTWEFVKTKSIYVKFVPVAKTNTMHIAKVEIRVTYSRVTTQAVDEEGKNQARGNGTNLASCNKRGFCWNKTGNPMVSDSKVEETNSFGVGSFSLYMTGLDAATHYYAKSYIYIDSAYEYGNQVEFNTLEWEPPVSDIDVGAAPIDRAAYRIADRTLVDKNNPANASGTLHSIKVFAYINLMGLRVGTFTANGNILKCRDSVFIGDVEAHAERTFTELSITVEAGDYIGCYFASGSIRTDTEGYAGIWLLFGYHIDPWDEEIYTPYEGDAMSLYGYGDIGAPAYHHGLKVQGEDELALCDVGSHPLRMRKGGITYGIELVATDDPNASRIRIKTSTGVKAIRKYT